MKRLASILLLIIVFFNFIGYRFVFNALQNKAEKTLVAKLDANNYNDKDLITITVPLSMPYLTNWKDFERKDGEITVNGKIYHYVKEKVFEGQLILKCLPDEQKMNLQTAKNDFFKAQNDIQNNTSKKSGESNNTFKLFSGDYENIETLINIVSFNSTLKNTTSSIFAAIQKGEILIPEQPPQA